MDNRLEELTGKIRVFTNDRGWSTFHNPKNLSMSIAIEAGELMEIFQWLTVEESWAIKDDNEKYEHIKEEIADVLIYCLSLSNQLEINILDAIDSKIIKNAEKYPLD